MSELLHIPQTGFARDADQHSDEAIHIRWRASDVALLTIFWAYVAASNILWGAGMRTSLANAGIGHVFADWDARLMQHVLIYPVLMAAMWLSRRVGWAPLWRTLPLQIAFAGIFSALAAPSMDVAETIIKGLHTTDIAHSLSALFVHLYIGKQGPLWLAMMSNAMLTYAFALALLWGFAIYRQFRDGQLRGEALERSLSAARLTALRNQLAPHTLFNLLHTIRGQIEWHPEVAQQMIVQLGDLLRRTLRAGAQDLSRLHDELEFARLYLHLQKQRFSDRLILQLPALESCPEVWVPSLILQPLIENAVIHGLANHTGSVTVSIEVLHGPHSLEIQVVNSIAPSHGYLSPASDGLGLRNLKERLAIQSAGGASLRSMPGPDTTWVAHLELPVLEYGDKDPGGKHLPPHELQR